MLTSYRALTGGFWRGETGPRAWFFTVLCGLVIIANIAIQYGINEWNRLFFNAIELKDSANVYHAMKVFAGLVVLSSVVAVVSISVRMRLMVNWRRWLTLRLTQRWLTDQHFLRLRVSDPELDSPEFRIAEDARVATEPVVDFGFGIVNAALMAVVFLGILWSAAGNVTIMGVQFQGYMVLVAIGYAVIMSGTMMLLGHPLIAYIGVKNATEAGLRQNFARVGENATSIVTNGEVDEEILTLRLRFRKVVWASRNVIDQLSRLTALANTSTVIAPVLPLLLVGPNYLNGSITLGALIQTAAAFVQVQAALNWLMDNYARIAEWMASSRRVVGLWTALDALETEDIAAMELAAVPGDAGTEPSPERAPLG
jgi:putative ATP-binding cassette transporter